MRSLSCESTRPASLDYFWLTDDSGIEEHPSTPHGLRIDTKLFNQVPNVSESVSNRSKFTFDLNEQCCVLPDGLSRRL